MNSPFSICTRLASVLSVPVRLNNRNDRTTGTMERDIKRYRPIHLLCFAKVFFKCIIRYRITKFLQCNVLTHVQLTRLSHEREQAIMKYL